MSTVTAYTTESVLCFVYTHFNFLFNVLFLALPEGSLYS